MHICNTLTISYLCIVTTLSWVKCSGSAQNNPIGKGEIPAIVDEGRTDISKQTIELADCACVEPFQCKNVQAQTLPMVTRCSPLICCLTDDIDESVLLDLLIGSPAETNTASGSGDGENDCACLNEIDCNNLEGKVKSSLSVAACPGDSFVCCILNITDTDLFTGIFGMIEPSNGEFEEISACKCVPEHLCAADLSLLVNVRASSASNICGSVLEVCCQENDILIEETVIPRIMTECECVPDAQCSTDLSLAVNVRTSVSTNTCNNPALVCCNKIDIIEEAVSIDINATAEECICVVQDDCLEIVGLSAIVNVRRKSGSTDCEDRLKTCCPISKIIKETSTLIDKIPVDIAIRECTCVQQKNCNPSRDSISFIVDVRSKSKTCNEPSSICCFPEDITVYTEESTPSCTCIPETLCSDSKLPSRDVSIAARCVEPEVCCKKPKEFEHTLSCGQSHITTSRIRVKISLGSQAKFAEFPWMVSIFEVNSNGKEIYKCGGSLIHPSIVLTTAHCIDEDNGNILKVRAGDWDIESIAEKKRHVGKYVTSRILHPSFSARRLSFNIGLLYLNGPIRLQYHINTICLPQSIDFKEYEQDCIATGWGKNEFGDAGKLQSTLKKIKLPLVDSVKCENDLRKTRLGPTFRLNPTVICAGGSREDTCTGDGGSPLICKMKDGSNRYMQVGAVAWGIECANPDIPGVYASTFSTVRWIRETVIRDFGQDAVNYFT